MVSLTDPRAGSSLRDERSKQYDLEKWSTNTGSARALVEGWQRGAANCLAGKYATIFWNETLRVWRTARNKPGMNSHIWRLIADEKHLKHVALESLLYVLGCTQLENPRGCSRNKLGAVVGTRAEYVIWLLHPVWGGRTYLKHLRLANNSDLGMKVMIDRLTNKGFKKAEFYTPLATHEKVALGTLLIELIAGSTKLIQISKHRGPKGWIKTVEYTDLFYSFLDRWQDAVHMFRVSYMPMLVPPRPWNDLVGGGYLTQPTKLTSVDPERWARLSARMDERVYGAVNYLQSVSFQLDATQVEYQRQAWHLGHEIGSIPRREAIPAPDKVDFKGNLSSFWRKNWEHKADQRKMPLRTKFVHALVGYEQLKEAERIYQVWHMDYRGRLYARGGSCSYMAGDVTRSWYEFEEKSYIADHEEDFAWCIGECYGLEHSQAARSAWLKANKRLFQAVATDPIGNLELWADAKEPWRFLKMARDWAAYLEDPTYRTGTVFQADQTMSGFGHVACMLRDGRVAKLSNVTGDGRSDIYEYIGAKTIELLHEWVKETKLADGEFLKRNIAAEWWLQNQPNRKLWKICVMPYIYGRTILSMRESIERWLIDQVKDFIIDEDLRVGELANVLSQAVHHAFWSRFTTLSKLQKFLSACARAQYDKKMRPHWATPNGLIVESFSSVTYTERVQLDLAGRPLFIDVPVARPRIDKRKSTSNLGADFVHSYEAAFLQRVVCTCRDYQIPLVTVHDCFGTTLHRYAHMRRALLNEWHSMYQQDWLGYMARAIKAETGAEIEPPCVGTLNLASLGENMHLFS